VEWCLMWFRQFSGLEILGLGRTNEFLIGFSFTATTTINQYCLNTVLMSVGPNHFSSRFRSS